MINETRSEEKSLANSRSAYAYGIACIRQDTEKYGYITRGALESIKAILPLAQQGDVRTMPFLLGVAREELNLAQRTGELQYALLAARHFKIVGHVGRTSVQHGLTRALEKAEEIDWMKSAPWIRSDYAEAIRETIQ